MEVFKKFLSNLIDLLDVKSIVTFLLIGTLCYLAVTQSVQIPSELLAAVISSIITYFFTKQTSSK